MRQQPEFRRQNFQRVQPARPVAAARPQPAPLTYGIAWAVAVCACPGESVLRGPGCVPRWCARDGPDRRPTCPSRVSPRCERGPGFHPRLPARSAGRGAQAAPVSGSLPRAATGPPMPRHAPPGTLGAPSGAVGSDRERGCARPPIPLASTGSRRVVTRTAAIRSLLGRKVSRTCATLHPRVHSRAPLRAPTCAKDAVNGADPGPSQGLDVQTWIRRIVTTGASSQDAHGCC